MTKRLIPYVYCILLAFVSVAVFSYTTSPFYFEPSSGDSAVFQIVGKYWVQGYLPYVDLWDQKGPIIHFVNCVGYLLTGTSSGVFIFEFLFISLTLTQLAAYRSLTL